MSRPTDFQLGEVNECTMTGSSAICVQWAPHARLITCIPGMHDYYMYTWQVHMHEVTIAKSSDNGDHHNYSIIVHGPVNRC